MVPLIGAAMVLGTAGQFASGILSAQARQAEFAEALRQLQRKKEYTLSLTSALSAANGTLMSSVSTQGYLKGMTQEFDKQIHNLKNGAGATGVADFVTNISSLIGGIAATGLAVGKATNWTWGTGDKTTGMAGLPMTPHTLSSAEWD